MAVSITFVMKAVILINTTMHILMPILEVLTMCQSTSSNELEGTSVLQTGFIDPPPPPPSPSTCV